MANGSTTKPGRNGRPFEGRNTGFRAGFAAAAVLIVSLVATGIVTLGQLAANHWPADWTPSLVWKSIRPAEKMVELSDKKPSLFGLHGKTMYITMFYKGHEKSVQTWKATFHGSDDMTVEITDIEHGNKVRGTALASSGGISISYASHNPGRPGFGNFALRPDMGASASDPVVFSGTGIVFACECADGSISPNADLLNVPVLMTDRPVPTREQRELFLSKEGREAIGVKPEELRGRRRHSSMMADRIKLAAASNEPTMLLSAVTKKSDGPPRACSCSSAATLPLAA